MRKKHQNSLLVAVGILAVAFLIYAVMARKGMAPVVEPATNNESSVAQVQTPEEKQQLAEQKAALAASTSAIRYEHPTLGFSFEKPAGFSVGAIPGENGGQTLIVQPTSGGSAKQGFQIVISPLDGPMDLTPAFIKEQLPGTTVSGAQKIVLDGVGKGLMFSSNNETFGGKSFEIWFTAQNNVYQITSYQDFSKQLQGIIGTWRFKQ